MIGSSCRITFKVHGLERGNPATKMEAETSLVTRVGSSRRNGNVVTILALTAYALAVILRMPEIVLKGRFWAEEGTFFFVNAWTLDPVSAVLQPVGSYLNLAASGAAVVARWSVPLEYAPYVTIAVALVFQLFPPLLLLVARDGWLENWVIRIGGLCLLLLVPGSDEIWLNTLHSQFQLMLCCGLVLALDVPVGWRLWFHSAILFLAPLCGPGAIALLPLFGLRALVDRSSGRAIQTVVLAASSLLQLIDFFDMGASGDGRGAVVSPLVFLLVVTVKDLVLPFLGIGMAERFAAAIRTAGITGPLSAAAMVAPVVVFGAVAILAIRRRIWVALWLLAGAAVSAVTAYFGALDGMVALLHERAGARYAFVPLSLTALCFLALAANTQRRERWVTTAICTWMVIVGLRAFTPGWLPVRNGPAWRTEVTRWRADPTHLLLIWPSPWVVQLDGGGERT